MNELLVQLLRWSESADDLWSEAWIVVGWSQNVERVDCS